MVKIFLPHIRWYRIALASDLDTALAVVQRGASLPDVGMVSLTDIVNSRLVISKGDTDGMRPDRDLYIPPRPKERVTRSATASSAAPCGICSGSTSSRRAIRK